MQSPLRRLCCAAVLFASAATLRALTVDPGDGTVSEGVYSSAAIVDGHPAIAYANDQDTAVKFVRATDASGAAWGAPVIVDSAAPVGRKVSLRIVDGIPAICYTDLTTGNIKYARATTPTGSVWPAPVMVNTGAFPGEDFSRHDCTLEIAAGNPAICLSGTPQRKLLFIRATDPTGSAWGTPVEIGIEGEAYESCMRIVQGRPAIVYGDGLDLWYVHATDTAGTAWNAEVHVALSTGTFFARQRPSLEIINGHPALCFFNDENRAVFYQRATDAAGTSWGEPVTVSSASVVGSSFSLAVVNGRPAVGHPPTAGILGYVRATDSEGAASWGSPVYVDTIDGGDTSTLLEVNGNPALVYHDGHGLKYLRATDASDGLLWPPQIRVSGGHLFTIPRGGELSFAPAPVGGSSPVEVRVFNHSGSVPLTSVEVAIDGPGAAEFRVSSPPVTDQPRLGGISVYFTLEYAPVKTGVKTADLHIITYAEGVRDSYDLRLTGATLPDIAVERFADVSVNEGATIRLPMPVPGVPSEFSLTIRNTGVGELNGFGITFDGPDAGEFSVSSAPSAFVPPGGITQFTVRHATATAGRKTAAIHIASNVAGDKNPFDLTLAMVPGTPDPSFHPAVEVTGCFALQADGKIVAGAKGGVVRLLPDGGFDTAFFSPPLNTGGFVHCIAVQKDGKILLSGEFSRAGGRERRGLARILTDGSLDEGFTPAISSGTVGCITVQPDGKILAGGFFGTSAGVRWLARFHTDGSLDTSFHPSPDAYVRCLALQPDGKILAGGYFENMHSTAALHIARVHPDGTPDTSFSAGFSESVGCLVVQPDGRIVAGGNFPGGIARLFPDGTRDEAMTTLAFGVYDLALQADGRCLAAGAGTNSGGPFYFQAGGSLDAAFHSDTSAAVLHLSLQADGKVLCRIDGGGVVLPRLARLDNDPGFNSLKTSGSSTVRWLRSGSAPEVRDVTFDVKPDSSSDWTRLGTAARIPGGWGLSGLALPSDGLIRAQAYAGGSVMEQTAPILSPLASWRLQHFNTPDNTGPAADDADPDHDGLTNFTEFAFGLNPADRASNNLPEFKHDGTSLTATFTSPAGTEDLIYSAEWSPDMQPGMWTNIPDTGSGTSHVFRSKGGDRRKFMRYALRAR